MIGKVQKKIRIAAALLASAFLGLALLPMTAHAVPIISVSDVSLLEGDSGTTFFRFTVSLSEASTEVVGITVGTANGTAIGGIDFTQTEVGATFVPGAMSFIFIVFVAGDIVSEPDETFFVNLSNPLNVTIGDGGVGTILNDDGPLVAVTEPAPLGLFVIGLMALGILRRVRVA